MLAFQSRSSFCVKVCWKVSCASEASKEKDEMEKNCCNYFPLKPMIWMVIFRLAPDGIISCNPLLSERRTFAVCARWSQSFLFFLDFRTIRSIGMLENVPPEIQLLFSDNRACDARDVRRRHKRKIACESLSRIHRNTPFASRWERFTSFHGAVIVTLSPSPEMIAHIQVFAICSALFEWAFHQTI